MMKSRRLLPPADNAARKRIGIPEAPRTGRVLARLKLEDAIGD
jgi:hypothetical protein